MAELIGRRFATTTSSGGNIFIQPRGAATGGRGTAGLIDPLVLPAPPSVHPRRPRISCDPRALTSSSIHASVRAQSSSMSPGFIPTRIVLFRKVEDAAPGQHRQFWSSARARGAVRVWIGPFESPLDTRDVGAGQMDATLKRKGLGARRIDGGFSVQNNNV